MACIALLVHPARPEVQRLASDARSWWRRHGYGVVELTPGTPPPDGLELAVSLGGDGTMLRAVQLASPHGVPVLGVNLGRMGYLTEVEPAGLESAFARFLAGEYAVAERMMLAVRLERGPAGREAPPAGSVGSEPDELVALNEAIVEKIAPGRTIRVEVAIAARPFLTYTADGLIVSTPTGSTAYNLSARGPIVSPSLRALVVTPISPHMLFDRSLVLDPAEAVTLRLADGPQADLVLDGTSSLRLSPGDSVSCAAALEPARLVTFGVRDFHAILRAKFGLAGR